jgi:hypothetical protein
MTPRSRLRLAGRGPRLWLRLERAAGQINPFLMAIAIGLLVVNISCYAALEIGRLHQRETSPIVDPAPPLGWTAVIGLPRS